MATFCHLHCHSEMSLLDGMSRIREIPRRVRELGMDACALTDHGVLYGAVDFVKACDEAGVKPIVGVEGYLARRTLFDKEPKVDEGPFHMLLLAETDEGYRNLMAIVSKAWTEGFYHRPRTDRDHLAAASRGLIATSGCLSGEIPSLLLEDRDEEARRALAWYVDVFGRERFFLEVMDHGLPEEAKVVRKLRELARHFSLGLVAAQDAHYLRREDARAHDVLLCIQTGKTITEPGRMKYPNDNFYLRSPEEMAELFREIPEALENTVRIAERVTGRPEIGGSHLPDFPCPEGVSPAEMLRALVAEHLPLRYPHPTPEVRERAAYELSVIERMGFESYFLITQDFVGFARRRGIAVGPGRGSAAGSLVAYVLGITDLDPIEYHLFFERFLNPERITMPDIDIDFDYNRRDEVIAYVIERYGRDRVAHIITFGTMAARAAIRDVSRVLELSYGEADRLAKLVPNELGITLERALETSSELRSLEASSERVREVLELARAVEGMPRHASVHAAGIVIAPRPLPDLVPLQRMNDGTVVTQFPMTTLEELGLLKMDFLGLRTLTVIEDTRRLLEARGGSLDVGSIPLDDPEAYALLSRADTYAVFQMESPGMRQVLRDLEPSRIEDVIAAVSLFRPGPMENIPLFIEKKKSGKVTYLHPDLEPILADTYGVMVYQEQVMEVAATMAGYSLGQADLLRRAMGKKKAEILEAEEAHFIEGCLKKGHSRAFAKELFDLIFKFANYGFNRAHGAAYGLLAYRTAYLKAHYPAEYLAAHLSSVVADDATVAEGLQDARAHGIAVHGPDVNLGEADFSVAEGTIRVGTVAVKGVGRDAAQAIASRRPYRSFFDFLSKNDHLNRRTVESLIRAGALDAFGTRRTLLEALAGFLDEVQRRRRQADTGQMSLFGDEGEGEPTLGPERPDAPGERLRWEQESLGFFLSGHPLDAYEARMAEMGLRPATSIREMPDGQNVKVAGVVTRVRRRNTRSGDPMARLALSDRSGEVEAVVFPQAMRDAQAFLEVGLAVLAEGRVDQGEDGTTLIVARVESLAEEDRVILRHLPEAKTVEMRSILSAYPGRSQVYLERDGDRIRMPGAMVDARSTFFLEALRGVLGAEGFFVEGASAFR